MQPRSPQRNPRRAGRLGQLAGWLLAGGALLLLAAGCGSLPAPGTTNVQGSVTLPAATGISPTELTVHSSLTSAPVDSQGHFELQTSSAGLRLTVVEDAAHHPLLMGWVGAKRSVLSARTTAEVMVYYASGAFARPPQASVAAATLLASSKDLGPLTDAISQALAKSPAALVKGDAGIKAALKSVLATLKASVATQGILFNPPSGKSGIDVNLTGDNDVTLTNHYRRRAAAFIDQVSYVTGSGAARQVHDLFRPSVATVDVPPTTGVTSITGTLGDVIAGNYAWAPVSAKPMHLAVNPADATRSTYRLTVVGLGAHPGALDKLSATQFKAFMWVTGKTILLDYAIPLVLTDFSPLSTSDLAKTEEELKSAELLSSVQDLISALAGDPAIVDYAKKGDMRGATEQALQTILGSNKGKEVLTTIVHGVLAKVGGAAVTKTAIDAGVKSFEEDVFKPVNLAFQLSDWELEDHQIGASDMADQWTLTVDKGKVRLSPARSYMVPSDYNHIIKVSGLDTTGPNAPVYAYDWSTSGKGGTLSDSNGHYATSFSSSDSFVAYNPNVGFSGTSVTDSVSVDVYKKGKNNQEAYVGSAQATVTIVGTEPLVVPHKVSVKPGASHSFHVDLNPPLTTSAPVFVKWTTSGNYGSLDAAKGLMPRDAEVTYTAKSGVEGKDTVTADVYVQKNGKLASMGEAEATVLVEKVPSVVYGHLVVEVVPEANHRQGVYAIVVAPKVAGAKRYDLFGYDFFDRAYYGRSLSETAPPFALPKEVTDVAQGWTLTAQWGPAGDPSKTVNADKARFAGAVWEITVTR